ncbi:MAG: TorF family putative porin [Cellvibrionaceae bacterium]|nr:TorF family putative porin [Cellvibrionaceae bacterium]
MKTLVKVIAASAFLATTAAQAEVSANLSVSNNYLWRGLTQTTDQPAVSGGVDYSSESGFYAGTWISNVSYGNAVSPGGDDFSYEHDLYFGYGGEAGAFTYDVSYLYINYNEDVAFDFSELVFSLGLGDFSATLNLLAHTEPDEEDYVGEGGGVADFGFGSAFYVSLDYGMELSDGWSVGFHAGYHEGDFVEAFNFGDQETYDYIDYNVSFAKEAFTLTISQTDLDTTDETDTYNNDDMKFVVAYSFDI